MGAWEDGFAAGYKAGLGTAREASAIPLSTHPVGKRLVPAGARKKKARKASAYNKRYGAAFKRLAPRYKTKAGKWKKDGFKRCGAAARKAAKK